MFYVELIKLNSTANCKIKWFLWVAFRSLNAPTNKISETEKILCPALNFESNDFTNLTLTRLKFLMTVHKIDPKQNLTRNKCKENLKRFSLKTTIKRKLFQKKTYSTY
jgi:hypothetical protein